MTVPDDDRDAKRAAGERAVKNTALRAVGEVTGKLASLLLFAVLARKVGASRLGDFVFGMAWAEVAMTPVGLGIDRYMLRRVAREQESLGRYYFNALAMKTVRGGALLLLSIVAVVALGFAQDKALLVCILTAGMLLETMARTHQSVFNAFERGDLVASTLVVQRFAAAALGLAALFAGLGVVGVAVGYAIGGVLRLAMSSWELRRHIGTPPLEFPRDARAELRARSLPFMAQDLFGLVLARVDVLLLSLLASSATVGIYGAAYRLLDSTSFIGASLSGAFSAMFTYLGAETVPTIRSVFQRSIKLSLIALMPIGVTLGVLAEPICRVLFGPDLIAAAVPLRLLAPVVVMFGVVVLCGSLIVSRHDPRRMLVIVGVAGAANVALNLALIPPLGAKGAALAMLLSEIVYLLPAGYLSVRAVGGVHWLSMTGAPLLAGAFMAIPMLLLGDYLVVALIAGALAYLGAFVAVERVVSPADLEFARDTLLKRLRRRAPA